MIIMIDTILLEESIGENMGSYKIGNRLLLRSQIEIEPSYEVSFHHDTITVKEECYSHSKDVKENVIMTTVNIFLKINTIFGNTHVEEIETTGMVSSSRGMHRLENNKRNLHISDMTYQDELLNERFLGGQTAQHVFGHAVLWKQETFDEKVLTDFLDKYLFKYTAQSCICKLAAG
jgi:hypothetical protein